MPAPDGGGQAEASAGMAQSLREGRRKTHFGCQAQVLLSFTTPAMSVDGYEVGGRWAPQGKATGDSLSIGRNSKTRIAGQLRRGGPAQTTYFLLSKSGDGSDHTCAERLLGGQRGVMSRNVLLRCLFSKIQLG